MPVSELLCGVAVADVEEEEVEHGLVAVLFELHGGECLREVVTYTGTTTIRAITVTTHGRRQTEEQRLTQTTN